ncbi:MAG: benzoate transporter BenE [Alphaproteobacteria bacterium]|nr:benzoate transporter BenE [Alphaproteobacteria bacterium]
MSGSVVVSAVVAVIVGFGGTLALIVAAAQAVGADAAEISSWVAALCLAMAATSAYLSVRHRLPVVTAWSTPGAALIAASTGIDLAAAIGAFLLAGALVLLTALFRPLGSWIERIPTSVAAAMLAGVLLRFVIAVFDSAESSPLLVLPLVALFLAVRLASPFGAVLVVLVAGVVLAEILGLAGPLPTEVTFSALVFTRPSFEPAVLIGLGLPLYLVTMASQNLPGFAVLRAAGYPVPSRSILAATGLASVLTAPFGAHASNLAAITASICTGPDAHPDASKRWLTGPVYGASYLVLAVFGASLVSLFQAMPPALIVTIAGTALIGPLAGALGSALAEERQRVAATLTLAVTASGVSFLGIGSAFWGLSVGLLTLALTSLWARAR